MANLRVELNVSGVREMLRSQEAKAICEKCANEAAGRLGEGYEVTTYTGQSRVNASVFAKSLKAKKENEKNNTMLKALRGGK